jgi:hypothetical protein
LENLKLHGLARSSQGAGRRWPARLRQTKGRNDDDDVRLTGLV